MKVKLDAIDRKILGILQSNSNITRQNIQKVNQKNKNIIIVPIANSIQLPFIQLHHILQSQINCIAYQRMTNRYFQQAGYIF